MFECNDRGDERVATSALTRSRLADYVSVLDARPDALDQEGRLDLAAELTACAATLDWRRCQVASGFALRERQSEFVISSATQRGGIAVYRIGGVDTPEVPESAVTELALASSISECAARDLIAVGLDLRYRLRCVASEFGGGRITYQHARVISEATRELSLDAVEQVDDQLAEAALTRTPARLRVLARRLVAKADAAAMERRHRQAHDDRSATGFDTGDGMGAYTLTQPSPTVRVIDDYVTAWARRRRLLDPTTGLDAHRADAAAHLLLGKHPVTGKPLLTSTEVNGYDIESEVCDRMVDSDRASWPRVKVLADPSQFLPAHTELRVTVSADTLLGIDDEACQLDGYGPITAQQARQLALQSASTTLRRVFTDPADDSILFLDANRYRFTRNQVEHVRSVYPISTFPGAITPADRCDIDHRLPYRSAAGSAPDPPSQTVVANGHPAGRRHHRYVTHSGWSSYLDPEHRSRTVWTSPHGRTYVTDARDGGP